MLLSSYGLPLQWFFQLLGSFSRAVSHIKPGFKVFDQSVQFFTAMLVHSCYTVTTLIETSAIGFSSA